MRSEEEIRDRIRDLEDQYNDIDPPSSPVEDEMELTILRAIEELEWVLEEHNDEPTFTT